MNTHDSNTVIAQTVVSDKLPLRKWLYSWLLDPAIEGNYHKAIENFIARSEEHTSELQSH